jgi:ATP-dependent Lhr-like helicase
LLAAGEFAWLRPVLAPPRELAGSLKDSAAPGPIRTTAIAFVDRLQLDDWQAWLVPTGQPEATLLTPPAATVQAALQAGGALFFNELERRTGLATPALVAALGELVAAGLITNDGFAGLRALLMPVAERGRVPAAGRRVAMPPPLPGRWSLVGTAMGRGSPDEGSAAARLAGHHAELLARTLLARYGVVFRTALTRESRWLPPWRDLVRVWRRLEARGEIRGGRFVAGFGGEQYALPEAVEALRAARHGDGAEMVISAADPLNLTGSLSPGARVPAIAGNRVLYRDGIAVAAQLGATFQWLAPADRDYEWTARTALLRGDPRLAAAPDAPPS